MRIIIFFITIVCLSCIRNICGQEMPVIIFEGCNMNGSVIRNISSHQDSVEGANLSIISFEASEALVSQSIAVLYDKDGNILGYEEVREDNSQIQNKSCESVRYLISLGKYKVKNVSMIEIIEDECHPSPNRADDTNSRTT